MAIQEGEQITYDYGIRNESAVSPKKSDNHPPKHSLESYRRFRFCPVPGCTTRKPLKKLSNHLTALHPGRAKWERYLKEAKRAEPRTHAATQVLLKVQRTLLIPGPSSSHVFSDDENAPDSRSVV